MSKPIGKQQFESKHYLFLHTKSWNWLY